MIRLETVAELWLTAAGHSLWEHLDGEPMPWRKAAWDRRALSDPRAEALLIGIARYEGEVVREAAARTGLEAKHFQDQDARAVWQGERRPEYEEYAWNEYLLTSEAVLIDQAERWSQGERSELHNASDVEVAYALADRLVRLYQARELLQQAEGLINEPPKRRAAQARGIGGGVPL